MQPAHSVEIVRKLRRHKRPLSWLSAAALLWSLLAGAWAPVQAKAVTIVDDVLGPMILCAPDAHGPGLDGNGAPGDRPAGHCQACLMLAQAQLAVAVVLVGIAFSVAPASAPEPILELARRPRLETGGIGSRAPPLSA
ncbi:MAG TPA: hypothetical protein VFA64_04495 [Hyphomicrobiaceae bacterium]|nr:hypothetical protein [Hyphomicrobiaceae bacterium]